MAFKYTEWTVQTAVGDVRIIAPVPMTANEVLRDVMEGWSALKKVDPAPSAKSEATIDELDTDKLFVAMAQAGFNVDGWEVKKTVTLRDPRTGEIRTFEGRPDGIM